MEKDMNGSEEKIILEANVHDKGSTELTKCEMGMKYNLKTRHKV